MKKLLFIRHGATAGNLERRYIGRTDEPLCDLGREQIANLAGKFSAHTVLVSPMLRTRQTADLLFPGMPQRVVSGFRETDFGIFEGKTYAELSGCPAYAAWVQSGCTGQIPEGEGITQFKERCCKAFEGAVSEAPENAAIALVVHGGVIMAILEAFGKPKKDFYSYHISNGEALICDMVGKDILNIKRLSGD